MYRRKCDYLIVVIASSVVCIYQLHRPAVSRGACAWCEMIFFIIIIHIVVYNSKAK